MKTLFIFSDVHGYYNELISALNVAGFNEDDPDHILISLGDVCDRGPDSKKLLQYLNSVDDRRKIMIVGNHELLMEDVIKRGYYEPHDRHNKTNKTVNQLTGYYGNSAIERMNNNRLWREYRKNWRWYFELDDYIFVHGYIPSGKYNTYGELIEPYYDPNWRNADKNCWLGATWTNGMYAWSLGIREPNKTIFCGHYHVSWGHSYIHNDGDEFIEDNGKQGYERFDPFIDDGIVAIDACTSRTHKVNVVSLEIDDKQFEKWNSY